MRKSGQKRDSGDKKKALYTWSGCGLVVILTLVTVLPNMGAGAQPDYSSFSSSKMQDLADLPFGTDAEAADFLRNNPEYKEVSNLDLLNSLFSSADRKERQMKDKEEGNPPPPDPEYKEIFQQRHKAEKAKEIVKERNAKRIMAKQEFAKAKEIQQVKEQRKALEREQKRVEREQQKRKVNAQQQKNVQNLAKVTQKNDSRQVRASKDQPGQSKPATLGGGSKAGGSGASSAVTGSIWGYEGKNINTGNATTNPLTSKDIDLAMDKGRAVGLDAALLSSAKGANAGDAEGAASGAIDAFQREVTAEDLDKAKQQVGIDEEEELPDGVDMGIQDELDRAINDEAEKNNNDNGDDDDDDGGDGDSTNTNCIKRDGSPDWSCWGMNALTTLFNELVSGVSGCITGGCGGNDWKMATNKDGPIMKDGAVLFYDSRGNTKYVTPKSNG